MLNIVNSRGISGALGARVRGVDGARYFVTCSHILYGGGAQTGEKVYAVEEARGRRSFIELGRTVSGYRGQVTAAGRTCFVDCALATLESESGLPALVRKALRATTLIAGVGSIAARARVSKRGWITGHTHGIAVDTDYFDRPCFEEHPQDAPGQILIRSESEERCFSVPGESGAAVIDEEDRIVGFLWGCNTYGEGIAFPASPALDRLGVTLECAGAGGMV